MLNIFAAECYYRKELMMVGVHFAIAGIRGTKK
jgi:hypothetical protein